MKSVTVAVLMSFVGLMAQASIPWNSRQTEGVKEVSTRVGGQIAQIELVDLSMARNISVDSAQRARLVQELKDLTETLHAAVQEATENAEQGSACLDSLLALSNFSRGIGYSFVMATKSSGVLSAEEQSLHSHSLTLYLESSYLEKFTIEVNTNCKSFVD